MTISQLSDGNGCVRKAVAEALDKLGELKWKQIITGDFEKDIDALAKSRDTRVVEPLIRTLRDGDKGVRKATAEALGTLGDARAVEPLIKALGDGQSNVRKTAADALEKLGESKWKQIITGDFEKDIDALVKSRDTRVVEPLIRTLRDGDKGVRKAAAEALGKLGDTRALEPLIKTLGDGNGCIRKAVAEALDKLGEPKWKQIITGDLKNDVTGLEKSNDARAVEPLIRMLRDGDWEARLFAAEALGKLGDARAVEPLIKVLNDNNKIVRIASASSLIDFAKNQPRSIINQWASIAAIVGEKHKDRPSHNDGHRPNDCSHYDWPHTDSGIGLRFPDKPKDLDF